MVDNITSKIGVTTIVQYLNNLISFYSSCPPKIEYFPDEHGDLYELYGDKEIPGVKELVKPEPINEECLELAEIECHVCGVTVQSFTAQSELKRFLQQQEAGLDVLFKCSRCRDCIDYKEKSRTRNDVYESRSHASDNKRKHSYQYSQNRLVSTF